MKSNNRVFLISAFSMLVIVSVFIYLIVSVPNKQNSFEYINNMHKDAIYKMIKFGDKDITEEMKDVIYTILYILHKLEVSDIDNIILPQIKSWYMKDITIDPQFNILLTIVQEYIIKDKYRLRWCLDLQNAFLCFKEPIKEVLTGQTDEWKFNQGSYDMLRVTYSVYKVIIDCFEKIVQQLSEKYNVPHSNITKSIQKKRLLVLNSQTDTYDIPSAIPTEMSFLELALCDFFYVILYKRYSNSKYRSQFNTNTSLSA